ncbi:hypothetical protein N7508_008322 [Penicillium antarcticum]|uniref:uncharacterized protein n=1 Tax=Penicillium antarcticum TaxID=416450 RepID=UPI0023984C6F|nr:uncharacterized protein N7508_008322 [Penicillium antarcticum]KAJ5298073.1 hypothetical protein N7508_008322 [Penicillium antarcticum]
MKMMSTKAPASPTLPSSVLSPSSPTSLIPTLAGTSLSTTAQQPKSYPLPQMKADLNVAINNRGKHYTSKSALIVFWEKDDTLADSDAETLKAVLTDCFGINALVYKIEANDKTPAWNLRKKIQDRLNSLRSPRKKGQSLYVFAYIGHGRMEGGELHLCSGSGKDLRWGTVRDLLFRDSGDLDHIDALGFLDCCYAGGARSTGTRALQILAATNKNQTMRSRRDGITFTQRFGKAVRSLRKSGAPIITTTAILADLERERPLHAPRAELKRLGTAGTIALGFKPPHSASYHGSPYQPFPPHPTREKHVLVHLTIEGNAQTATNEFRKVIEALPADMQVSLVDAFETYASAIVLFRMTYSAWATLSATVDFKMVDLVIGRSLLHHEPTLRVLETVNLPAENSPSLK